MTIRYKKLYEEQIKPELKQRFGIENDFAVPRLDKIVINIGEGRAAVQDSKKVGLAAEQLALIAGQKPVVTRARKSIATFKLREGMPIGCKVTLRGRRMYEFLDRLITIAMPRIRDFRGISDKGFDGNGNYAFGLKEQIVFPEINYDKVDALRGMDIVICTTASTNEQARELLKGFHMPFRKRGG